MSFARILPLALLLACNLPEPELEGAHVRIAADPGLPTCGDNLAHMDHFITLLSAELGRPPPTGNDRIDYYHLTRGSFDQRTICVQERGGCAILGDVFSTQIPHDHEVVHAVAWPDGVSAAFFIEGLAVAYEYSPPHPPQGHLYPDLESYGSLTIEDAIESRAKSWLTGEAYPLAGAFTAFLIERHGIDAYMRVYRRLQLADDFGLVARAIEREFGESLASLIDEFDRTRRDCPPIAFNRKLIECSAPEIAWDGVLWADYRALGCDQDDVVGPFDTGTVVTHRTIVVPEDAIYTLDVVGDSDTLSTLEPNAAELVRCGGCDGFVRAQAYAGQGPVPAQLRAGTYALSLRGPAERTTGIGVRIELQSPAVDEPPGP